jgi:hypothetical protein
MGRRCDNVKHISPHLDQEGRREVLPPVPLWVQPHTPGKVKGTKIHGRRPMASLSIKFRSKYELLTMYFRIYEYLGEYNDDYWEDLFEK